MYIPQRFLEADQEKIDQFIQQNSFATLVSHEGVDLIAAHLPLELEREEGVAYLRGHLARPNQQWRTFNPSQNVLAIFTGPHAYVSARWYNHLNVPTWNYIAVHVYGKPRLITAHDELYAMLKRLVDKYEATAPPELRYRLENLPPDFVKKEMRGIVGIEIKIERLEAKAKLSQNRNAQDYDNIIAELEKSPGENARSLAAEMRGKRQKLFGEQA